jgi:predicted HicB family RNase H-like nuclease
MGRPYKSDERSTRRGKTIRIPLDLHARIAAAAKAEKVSIPTWIMAACSDVLTYGSPAATVARRP